MSEPQTANNDPGLVPPHNPSAQPSVSHNPLPGKIEADSVSGESVVAGNQYNNPQIFNYYGGPGGSPAGSPEPPPFILPQGEVPEFTGRKDTIKKLETLLLNPADPHTARIVGLTGTGGMGKSALAVHFAYLYRDRFPDGIIGLRVNSAQEERLASAEGLTPVEKLALAEQFADLAGVRMRPGQKRDADQIMQRVLSQKQALIILDNAEEVLFRTLSPGMGKCAIIVTTRNQGLLRGFGIPVNAHIDLQPFTLENTKELLSKMLGEKDQRVNAEPQALEEIHELVGGLPLAVRIVGGALQDQSFRTLASYATELREEKERLELLIDPNDTNLDVRASFQVSLRFLSVDEKMLFASLSACAVEGFALQTAIAVSGQDEHMVHRHLGRLKSLSLLNSGTKEGRLVLHPLLFLFSGELAEELKLAEDVKKRHTDYFIHYAQEHRDNTDALAMELDALLLTAKRLAGNLSDANNFYRSLEPFLEERGYWLQALELIELFLREARSRKSRDYNRLAQFLLQQGKYLQLLTRFNEAVKALQESQRMALQIPDGRERQRSLAMALTKLGEVYQRQRKFSKAIDAFKESLILEKESGTNLGQAKVWNGLGEVYMQQNKFKEAEEAFEKSVELGHESPKHRGQVLNSLGVLYRATRRFEKAIKVLKQSYDLRVKLKDPRGQAITLTTLGDVYTQQNNFSEAFQAYKKSLAIDPGVYGRAKTLHSLGRMYLRQGRLQEAIEVLQESRNSLTGDPPGQGMVWHTLGRAYLKQRDLNAAIHAFEESYKLRAQQGRGEDKIGQIIALNSWGEALLAQGQPEQAVEKWKAAFEIAEREAYAKEIGFSAPRLIRTCKQLQRIGDAQTYCRRALAIAPNERQLLKLQKELFSNS